MNVRFTGAGRLFVTERFRGLGCEGCRLTEKVSLWWIVPTAPYPNALYPDPLGVRERCILKTGYSHDTLPPTPYTLTRHRPLDKDRAESLD